MDSTQIATLIYLQMKNEILIKEAYQSALGHAKYLSFVASLYEGMQDQLELGFSNNAQLQPYREAVMKIYHAEKNPMED